jgi:hypothetical protein
MAAQNGRWLYQAGGVLSYMKVQLKQKIKELRKLKLELKDK